MLLRRTIKDDPGNVARLLTPAIIPVLGALQTALDCTARVLAEVECRRSGRPLPVPQGCRS